MSYHVYDLMTQLDGLHGRLYLSQWRKGFGKHVKQIDFEQESQSWIEGYLEALNIKGLITHEPVRLSRKTRRTKSSIEYNIRSKMIEQSASVASCFSLLCISVNAAMKNARFSR